MKTPASRIVRFAMITACLFASWPALPSTPGADSERSDWSHAIANARQIFESFPGKSITGKRIDSNKFYETEAECAAGAAAILSINDLLIAAPRATQINYDVLPDNNVVVHLRRGFADGKNYDFICLVNDAHELERVRLVGGFVSTPNPTEIDGIHFVLSGK